MAIPRHDDDNKWSEDLVDEDGKADNENVI